VPATPEKTDETEFIMLKDGVICFEGNARRTSAFRRSVSEDFSVLRTVMPRTRSLAWSELKIGVLTIAAIAVAAADDLLGDGKPRLLLAALHAEDALHERRRPQGGIAGPGGWAWKSAPSPTSSLPATRWTSSSR